MNETATCSQIASDLAEPLHGTASKSVRYWILLEDRSRWGTDAFQTASRATRDAIQSWTDQLEQSKAIGIRRKGRTDDGHMLFFADALTGQIWRWHNSDLEELLKLEPLQLLEGQGAIRHQNELFLVCTHGKRDQCCALVGAPVFLSLLDILDEERVWQATHLGGHRFAPNVLALPSGILYGRVGVEDATALVDAERNHRILSLSTFRGRCHLPRPVQYAEGWLRTRFDLLEFDALSVIGHRRQDNHWTVEFNYKGKTHQVDLQVRKKASRPRVVSCGDPPKPVDVYEVLEHRTGTV